MQHREMTDGRDWEAVAIPVALIVTGLILIGGDLMGVLSLDGIRNYWPMALISVGILELLAPSDSHRR